MVGFGFWKVNQFEQQLMYCILFHEQEKEEKVEVEKVEKEEKMEKVEVSPRQVPRLTESVVGEPD